MNKISKFCKSRHYAACRRATEDTILKKTGIAQKIQYIHNHNFTKNILIINRNQANSYREAGK